MNITSKNKLTKYNEVSYNVLRICNTILRQYFRNLSLTTSNNLCKNLKYLFLKYMIHTSNACTEKVINLLLYSCFHETLKELA